MRYEIRRVDLGSPFRIGLIVGFALMLLPTICGAALAVETLRRVDQTFDRLSSLTVDLPETDLGLLRFDPPDVTVDLVRVAGLEDAGLRAAGLTERAGLLFVALSVGGLALATLGFGLVAVLSALLFNALAPHLGGVKVELREIGDRATGGSAD